MCFSRDNFALLRFHKSLGRNSLKSFVFLFRRRSDFPAQLLHRLGERYRGRLISSPADFFFTTHFCPDEGGLTDSRSYSGGRLCLRVKAPGNTENVTQSRADGNMVELDQTDPSLLIMGDGATSSHYALLIRNAVPNPAPAIDERRRRISPCRISTSNCGAGSVPDIAAATGVLNPARANATSGNWRKSSRDRSLEFTNFWGRSGSHRMTLTPSKEKVEHVHSTKPYSLLSSRLVSCFKPVLVKPDLRMQCDICCLGHLYSFPLLGSRPFCSTPDSLRAVGAVEWA